MDPDIFDKALEKLEISALVHALRPTFVMQFRSFYNWEIFIVHCLYSILGPPIIRMRRACNAGETAVWREDNALKVVGQ
jgi:hypothetical protein